jgi:GxxExxY protein
MNLSRNRDPRTYAIIGAAMEVHKVLGSGYLEAVYHEALMLEFVERQIPFLHEADVPIYYKGKPLKTPYRADFICFDSVIVEKKTAKNLLELNHAQIINYLKATKKENGMLIKYRKESLDYKRFINTKK